MIEQFEDNGKTNLFTTLRPPAPIAVISAGRRTVQQSDEQGSHLLLAARHTCHVSGNRICPPPPGTHDCGTPAFFTAGFLTASAAVEEKKKIWQAAVYRTPLR